MISRKRKKQIEEVKKYFQATDTNGDGTIDEGGELYTIYRKVIKKSNMDDDNLKKVIKELFKKMDKNNDKQVDFEEFLEASIGCLPE